MLWLIVILTPIVSAAGPIRGPLVLGGPRALAGYPDVSGGFYPNGIAPNVHLGYLQPQGYERRAAGAGEYRRGGQDGLYKNYAQNARTNRIFKNVSGLASRDSDRWSGNQMVTGGAAGAQGYHGDAALATYNRGRNSAAGASAEYGTAGQYGYDGYGDEGHQKGHKTSGFHKSYHNIESGKDTEYIDEDHNTANRKFGQAHGAAYGNSGWGVRGQERDDGSYVDRVAYDAASVGAFGKAAYGSHDVNGYRHNQDLAHKRSLEQAEDYRLAKDGHHGMRARNGAIYHNELW